MRRQTAGTSAAASASAPAFTASYGHVATNPSGPAPTILATRSIAAPPSPHVHSAPRRLRVDPRKSVPSQPIYVDRIRQHADDGTRGAEYRDLQSVTSGGDRLSTPRGQGAVSAQHTQPSNQNGHGYQKTGLTRQTGNDAPTEALTAGPTTEIVETGHGCAQEQRLRVGGAEEHREWKRGTEQDGGRGGRAGAQQVGEPPQVEHGAHECVKRDDNACPGPCGRRARDARGDGDGSQQQGKRGKERNAAKAFFVGTVAIPT